jgi:uncharacterized membrane protein
MAEQQLEEITAKTDTPRSTMRFTIAQIVLSCLGAVDAGLLYLKHRGQVDLPCTADGGCETIANSTYAHVMVLGHDIPMAAIGLAGYVLLLSLSMAKAASETAQGVRGLSLALLVVSGGGTIYSWYLQYVAHFIIGAFCPYCFASACIMTTLFVVSAVERRKLRSAGTSNPGPTRP